MAEKKSETPEARVQEQVDEQVEKGLAGVEVDETPNENYTVAGVLAGKPTPETEAGKESA